jgi:hypothetical protein
MGFTAVAWSQSVDAPTLTAINAISDQHVRVVGPDIIVPRGYNQLLFVYAIGPNLTQARLQSPSLRRVLNLDILPLERAAAPDPTQPRWVDISQNPITLDEDEALNLLASEDATGASRISGFVLLGDGERREVSGDIYRVRATSTDTAVAFTWSSVSLTFAQSLPAGRYQLVGSQHVSANAIFHRYVFVGGIWRPGAPSRISIAHFNDNLFTGGRFGVWGEFNHNTPPVVEVFCAAADASHTFHLDLIKVG